MLVTNLHNTGKFLAFLIVHCCLDICFKLMDKTNKYIIN